MSQRFFLRDGDVAQTCADVNVALGFQRLQIRFDSGISEANQREQSPDGLGSGCVRLAADRIAGLQIASVSRSSVVHGAPPLSAVNL